MLEQDINHVCRKIAHGAKFRLGRNHAGRIKLKLHTGPFGLFVRRFDLNDAELLRVRQVLDGVKSAGKSPNNSTKNSRSKPPSL